MKHNVEKRKNLDAKEKKTKNQTWKKKKTKLKRGKHDVGEKWDARKRETERQKPKFIRAKKNPERDGRGTRTQLELGDKKESLETIGCLFMDTA